MLRLNVLVCLVATTIGYSNGFSFGNRFYINCYTAHNRLKLTERKSRLLHVTNTSWKGPRSTSTRQGRYSTLLQMSGKMDPFAVLNIPEPTTDKSTIKKAYRRMAMKYHPDVVVSSDSTPEEKKKASDYFATINAAYETLMGKNSDSGHYRLY